MQELVRKEK